ncbi:cytochrome C oxidase subunit IV family protein [Rhodococcus sp. CX]|uniref:cytochrome C oxidase subunit IV family protein n=1 Tax=Rhodococcus sp. CX TaxID=2789880 RepID=UPI0018CE6505|nr:cytochrome C oxidase subunit IV family protein [Rhodococcus sp. CX]MBH0122487.1 cytochrome C oxidase subunit IV family protein [Rhodococcus sp. CX]
MTTTTTRPGTSTRTITVTWLVLTAVTIASWWLAPDHSPTAVGASAPITVLVLALAAVKCRLIIRTFMEVRGAPRWLQWATDGWLVTLIATVLVLYLI